MCNLFKCKMEVLFGNYSVKQGCILVQDCTCLLSGRSFLALGHVRTMLPIL